MAREAAYLNDLLLLVERYTALKAAFKGYGLQRAKLTDQLSAVMSGSVGTTYLSPEQQQRFGPRAHELEALVTQLRETAAADWDFALRVGQQFGQKVRAQLPDPTFPLLTLDSARMEAAQKQPLGPPRVP